MFDIKPYKQKAESAIAHLGTDLKKIRTGRAHPDMLDGVMVEVYGSRMPLIQTATINVPEPQQLLVTPFDPQNIRAIVEAIRSDQGLGFNPSDDGRVVRVPVPALTEERRREIVKQLGTKIEDAKITIRGVRQEALKTAKKLKDDKQLSENDLARIEKEIDVLTSDSVAKVDEIASAKEREIMTV